MNATTSKRRSCARSKCTTSTFTSSQTSATRKKTDFKRSSSSAFHSPSLDRTLFSKLMIDAFAHVSTHGFVQAEKSSRKNHRFQGIAEVENEEHCDFKILRDMLIRTHMQVMTGLGNGFFGVLSSEVTRQGFL